MNDITAGRQKMKRYVSVFLCISLFALMLAFPKAVFNLSLIHILDVYKRQSEIRRRTAHIVNISFKVCLFRQLPGL